MSPNVQYDLPGASGSGPFETLKDWIAAFESKFPEVDLSITSVGTGAAQSALWGSVDCIKKPIEALCDNTTGIAVSSTLWGMGGGALEDQSYVKHADRGLQQLPALAGPVLVVFSKDVTGDLGSADSKPLNLSPSLVAGIFNNTIRYWNDTRLQIENPHLELPAERITVVVRADKSGMSETFTQFLDHGNPSWPAEAVGNLPQWPLDSITDSAVACDTLESFCNVQSHGQTGIGISLLRRPYSIGYLELGYFRTLKNFVAQAHISSKNNPDDYQAATVDSVKETMGGLAYALDPEDLSSNLVYEETPRHGYPISRYVYWYMKQDHREYNSCYEAWLMRKFISWTYTDGIAEEIAVDHGWVVPPNAVANIATKELNNLRCKVTEQESSTEFVSGSIIYAHQFVPPLYRLDEPSENLLLVAVVPSIVALVLVLAGIGAAIYISRKRRKEDAIWKVRMEDLAFGDPPAIVGRGTFGQVVLAEYRGTQVAIKRVIPPRVKSKKMELTESFSSVDKSFSFGELSENDGDPHSSSFLTACHTSSPGRQDREKLRADFLVEMRYLAKLRHPCVITVMVCSHVTTPLLLISRLSPGCLRWKGPRTLARYG